MAQPISGNLAWFLIIAPMKVLRRHYGVSPSGHLLKPGKKRWNQTSKKLLVRQSPHLVSLSLEVMEESNSHGCFLLSWLCETCFVAGSPSV